MVMWSRLRQIKFDKNRKIWLYRREMDRERVFVSTFEQFCLPPFNYHMSSTEMY